MAATTHDHRDLIQQWITRPLPSLLLPTLPWPETSLDDPQCLQDAADQRAAAADELPQEVS